MRDGCTDAIFLLGPALDGELAAEDQAWLTAHLADCGTCRERQALLGAQGQALRENLEEASAQVDFSRFAGQVMARLEREPQTRAPLGMRMRAFWWEAVRPHRVAFASGGLLAAACAALVLALHPASTGDKGAPREEVLLASSDLMQAQIEQLDVDGEEGTVLQFPGQSTLIWIDEDAKPAAGSRQ